MTTTAGTIIRRALRLCNVLAAGETASAEDQADALESLNSMIDGWRNQSLMVYALRDESFSVTGAASYTIGTGGTFNTDRPVKVDRAFMRQNGIDYPIQIADAKAWFDIADKSVTSDYPDWLYYEMSFPLGKIFLFPKPSSGSLHLVTWVPITEFANASDAVSLPPGYREMLTYQLAMRLGPEYGKPVPIEVAAIGKAAKDDIGMVNFRVPKMSSGLGLGRRYNIYGDV